MKQEKLIKYLRKGQKKAQRGISGYGADLYEKVNEFCADVYAIFGLAADEIERLKEYEDMADQLTDAMQEWGWQHVTDTDDLIDEIQGLINKTSCQKGELPSSPYCQRCFPPNKKK